MRFGFPHHLVLFAVINGALFLLNMAPVGFDFDRPGVPLWFLYPLLGWGVLLLAHAGLLIFGIELRRSGAPEPQPAATDGPATGASTTGIHQRVDPSLAGRAGALLAECRMRSGQTLSALASRGDVPVDIDDLLRGALDLAEHLAELLGPIYQALAKGDDAEAAAERDELEARLEGLHVGLEILRLEAQVIQEEGAADLSSLTGPQEQLREAIMAAAEATAGRAR